MTRAALIIGNPGEPGAQNYCRGVEMDLVHYRTYLTSPVGGSWYESEIKVLNRPNIQDVRNSLEAIRSATYSFVVFSGHGCTEGSSTKLELRRGQEMDSLELRRGGAKRTVVLDCCRVISRSVLTEDSMKRALLAKADMVPQDTRKYFDEAVDRCPAGLVVQFACALGEVANDNSNSGGYYSSSLIRAGDAWADTGQFDTRYQRYYSFSVIQAHDAAKNRVSTQSGGRQNPHIEKPRSEPYFPFGIVA